MALLGLLLLTLIYLRGAQGDTPNLVLFSVDDEIVSEAWQAAYYDTIQSSGISNPNGCKPPITWFTSKGPDRGDCDTALLAYSAGHELATHTVTHPELPGLSYDEITAEVAGQREWLIDCGIPAEAITGFRAPYYKTDDTVTQVLIDLGVQYDSSKADDSPTQQAYSTGSLWEVPAYTLPGGDRRSDPQPEDGMSVLERLQAAFESKRGSGAPVSILVHEPCKLSNRDDIVAFLSWAFAQDNTWGITYQQYISWLEAGAGDIASVLSNYTCGS
ncbi:hypothetical protein CHLNCDRAFT_143035 [Chlorella variabilis]|uniref:NodB homology domain-containing protein n=1 Tax=Chlorella variabilis TaxID=554065 RepID=E1Z9C3_CHLVA|nr:hypothetical protein CHLNCDRAFT_143035 [Chlorella variabilis]EFN57754.1 hypothetical protein CHLNCDRAFT_143035 [Chlorella variabilis]|eukprot:XP_005849856.1 hypothetical protein CHLNCDRAFT_143035 [Chlorella variabilis]